MKTRQGFVSNSSSSSFMIVGKWLQEDIGDIRALRDKGLRYYEASEDGPCIGVDFDIEDTETWGAYKERVAKVLTDAGVPSEAKDIRICSGEYSC